jgi:uncharacterized protein
MTRHMRVRIVGSLRDISAEAWNACAHGKPLAPAPADESKSEADDSSVEHDTANPFVSHAFLLALENAGCVGGRSGWSPAYVIVESESGEILATAPSYLKSHSQGEYVFDHGWADAYNRAGGDYYPKIQVSVPFTPATGPRLLVAAGEQAADARDMLVAGLEALRRETGASSIHATFATEGDLAALGPAGYLVRHDIQFHWLNRGYTSYDAFLATLVSRKRKSLKRERRDALANGIDIDILTGANLSEAVWDDFFGFYQDTGARKWGRPYLTRSFFSEIGRTMADRTVLVMARRDGRYIAGAINFLGQNTLYGRNWGCIEEHPFLHFEVCYHRAIDYAIAHGLARVEAGAQGAHKLARGYQPVITRSAHYLADPGLKRAVQQYLSQERLEITRAQHELADNAPYHRTGENDAAT